MNISKWFVKTEHDVGSVTDPFRGGWIPTWEVPVILKGADIAVKTGGALIKKIKDEGPLLVQILDSKEISDEYHLALQVTNLTIHGIYIDSIGLEHPTECDSAMSKSNFNNFFSPADEEIAREESIHIPFGISERVNVSFSPPTTTQLQSKYWRKVDHTGKAKITFLVINESKSRTLDFTFSIRTNES